MEDRDVTLDLVSKTARETYGLEVTEMKFLDGYIDKNLWLRCSKGKEYVFRIKVQTFNGQLEKMIDEGLKHLQKAGFQVPLPISTVAGEARGEYEFGRNGNFRRSFPVHLTRFIPGNTVYKTGFTPKELCKLARNVGAFGGMMQNRLLSMNSDNRVRRDDFNIWYTENFPDIRQFTRFVADVTFRTKICNFIDRFQQEVIPRLPKLRQAYVHGDYSNTNIVVVDRHQATSHHLTDEQLLSNIGTIDFEYFHHGYIVFSLAVSMAYMMMQSAHSRADPIFVTGEVLRGYLEKFPLTDDELDVLFWGVVARLSSSYVMSARMMSEGTDPDADYVMSQSSQSCALLDLLSSLGDVRVKKLWLSNGTNGKHV